ncbi:TetR/AcrR family transcriptional regulator [Bifidobacterium avesanii]|uniref:TetR family transcriptional regulator n=1 Tax=Bifidobacterium avesanii TaxID=1798157 RepID=A0A7K3TGN8_9BIFI|nr:TetR/AcrR family transcriptional regulator [Bifidobacterium avesanii]KAB8293605.1 transcriptional regulator [Bifidobacterium avesanii]NEG78258.1 TetR family transcriptional regulator [Bifidobacterium avesanii]
MKKDLNAKLTRGAQRTLDAFFGAMTDLLQDKSFADISVNELCERAGYPRATFYNYFEDRDDLLGYCWTVLSARANLTDLASSEPAHRVDTALDAMADLLESNEGLLRTVLEHNPPEGPLFSSLHMFIEGRAREIMGACVDRDRFGLPADLIADHYANTLMLVLDWAYLRGHALTREQLHAYAHALLGGLE